ESRTPQGPSLAWLQTGSELYRDRLTFFCPEELRDPLPNPAHAGIPRPRQQWLPARGREILVTRPPQPARGTMAEVEELLRLENLRTWFHTRDGIVRAVDGISLSLRQGRTLGLVGESGCGKSVTALSIMRLVDPPGRVEEGSRILFEGKDLAAASEDELQEIRGNQIAMIFQEPMTSLNPVYTVGQQIAEAVELHRGVRGRSALEHAVQLLQLVGIPTPERRVNDYPHQMSGGMRQRVMIAMALACDPHLLIADEPTTAL